MSEDPPVHQTRVPLGGQIEDLQRSVQFPQLVRLDGDEQECKGNG